MRCQFGTRPDVTLVDYCEQMTSSIAAADVVVSMGGYNTVCEVLAMGTPAVIVPRVWPRLEQWIRCERLAALGLLRVLHPDGVSPCGLWRHITEAMTSARAARQPASGPRRSRCRDVTAGLSSISTPLALGA